MPCLELGPRNLGILQVEVIRRLCINFFLSQLKRVMPIAGWQNRRSGKQRGGMDQELYVLMIGVLGNHFSSLDNDVQTLLKPMHIRGQSGEILEIRLAKNAIGDASTYERADAMLRDLFKRGSSAFPKLLK